MLLLNIARAYCTVSALRLSTQPRADGGVPIARPLESTSTTLVKLPTVSGDVTTGIGVLGVCASNTITSVPPSIVASSEASHERRTEVTQRHYKWDGSKLQQTQICVCMSEICRHEPVELMRGVLSRPESVIMTKAPSLTVKFPSIKISDVEIVRLPFKMSGLGTIHTPATHVASTVGAGGAHTSLRSGGQTSKQLVGQVTAADREQPVGGGVQV